MKSINYGLWEVIQNGYHVPTKFENGMTFPKPNYEWDGLEKRNAQLNVNVICYLHCALDKNE